MEVGVPSIELAERAGTPVRKARRDSDGDSSSTFTDAGAEGEA